MFYALLSFHCVTFINIRGIHAYVLWPHTFTADIVNSRGYSKWTAIEKIINRIKVTWNINNLHEMALDVLNTNVALYKNGIIRYSYTLYDHFKTTVSIIYTEKWILTSTSLYCGRFFWLISFFQTQFYLHCFFVILFSYISSRGAGDGFGVGI